MLGAMATLERFLQYAADFEKTLADDDWSRLTPYFAEDAVYRVESSLFGCELTGPEAIFAGMRKSLEGFDRHFESRDIELTKGPDVAGDELRAAWTIHYHKPDLPDFVLHGESLVKIPEERIVLLVDTYDEGVADAAAAWTRETGIALDPSYT